MHRFFVQPHAIDGDFIYIEGNDANHIKKVLRLKKDEYIEICNTKGIDYICTVNHTQGCRVQCRIVNQQPSLGENINLAVHLYQGVPKGAKMEIIVQKAVELGALAITPFISNRCLSKIKNDDNKRQRYNRIAYEAAKQSKRGIVPQVFPTLSFKDAVEEASENALVLIAYEMEVSNTLKSILKADKMMPETLAVFVGPEGGFTENEIDYAKRKGAQTVSLGRRILRTETAGADILSKLNILYER